MFVSARCGRKRKESGRCNCAPKWNEIGADTVLEATGLFLDKASGEKHLAVDAKKVIFSAPSKDDALMLVSGLWRRFFFGTLIRHGAFL